MIILIFATLFIFILTKLVTATVLFFVVNIFHDLGDYLFMILLGISIIFIAWCFSEN